MNLADLEEIKVLKPGQCDFLCWEEAKGKFLESVAGLQVVNFCGLCTLLYVYFSRKLKCVYVCVFMQKNKGKISAKFRLVFIIESWIEERGEGVGRDLRSEEQHFIHQTGYCYIVISILYNISEVLFYILDIYQSKKIRTGVYQVTPQVLSQVQWYTPNP